jgi:hypothetical protein
MASLLVTSTPSVTIHKGLVENVVVSASPASEINKGLTENLTVSASPSVEISKGLHRGLMVTSSPMVVYPKKVSLTVGTISLVSAEAKRVHNLKVSTTPKIVIDRRVEWKRTFIVSNTAIVDDSIVSGKYADSRFYDGL